jgi:hypothetical protein
MNFLCSFFSVVSVSSVVKKNLKNGTTGRIHIDHIQSMKTNRWKVSVLFAVT